MISYSLVLPFSWVQSENYWILVWQTPTFYFLILPILPTPPQGCIFRLTCSYPELTEDHVLTSAYVKIFRTVTRNAVNKSVWGKKDSFWLPLNKHAMNIWLSSLRIRAHLSWRTGKHLLLENRKTSPCSSCALNLLHVLVSRISGYHNLCSPDFQHPENTEI